MITLSAKIRKNIGKKVKDLRKEGVLPAVLYGPKTKNTPLEVNFKEFEKIYKEAGESTLISLSINGEKKENLVLIHSIEKDPMFSKINHVDFYQPILDKDIEVRIPLVFDGEAPAVKDFGGTLIRHILEVTVRALPQNLPHEVKINVSSLKNIGENLLIENLPVPEKVKIVNDLKEIVVSVASPEKIEEELEKPIEEKVEEVEKVEKPKKEEETATEEAVEKAVEKK